MKEGKQKINIHDEKYKLTSSMNRKWTKLSNELNKLEKKEKKKKSYLFIEMFLKAILHAHIDNIIAKMNKAKM